MMKPTPQRPPQVQQGFTLIEVMITVVVIAILSAIAYPAYTEQVAKGRRAEAQATLLAGQQWMERFYSENYSYYKNSAGTPVDDDSQFEARFKTSPAAGAGAPLYDLAVSAPEAGTSYTITAKRKTGAAMAEDRCGDFSVDHLGRRKLENYSTKAGSSLTQAMAYCWK